MSCRLVAIYIGRCCYAYVLSLGSRLFLQACNRRPSEAPRLHAAWSSLVPLCCRCSSRIAHSFALPFALVNTSESQCFATVLVHIILRAGLLNAYSNASLCQSHVMFLCSYFPWPPLQ